MITVDSERVISALTDEQILEEIRSDSPLNLARKQYSSEIGRLDQMSTQRKPLSPIELRREEFMSVVRIINAYNRWLLEKGGKESRKNED